MNASTEVVETTASQELEQLQSEADRIAEKFRGGISADEIALPLIKLTQGLSKEVEQGKAPPGHFVNSVTGRDYGDTLELVIVDRFKGRFFSKKGSPRAWVARGEVAPDNWPDEYKGQRFVDLADAEEQFKEAVNRGEREWESGPPISTTENYIGFVRGETEVPVRLSLMRTSRPAATTINTLLKLQRAPWDAFVKLAVDENTNAQGQKSHKVIAAEGEATDEATKVAAVKLAVDLERVKDVVLLGDEADAAGGASKPAAARGAMSTE